MENDRGDVYESGSFSDLLPELERALSALPSEESREAIVLLREELERGTMQAADQRWVGRDLLGTPTTYYAIHSSDLRLLQEAAVVAAGLTAFGSKAVGVIGALTVFLWRFYQKRARLGTDQGVVLMTLSKAPPDGWTIEEVREHLPIAAKWDDERLISVLGTLREVILGDGTSTAFVAETCGKWRAVDV